MRIAIIILLFVSLQQWTYAQADTINTTPAHPVLRKIAKTTLAPVLLTGYGIASYHDRGFPSSYSIQQWRNQYHPNFHSSLDDYLWFAPVATVYGLNFIGVKGENNFWCRSLRLGTAQALTFAFVLPTKHFISELRPDGSSYTSMPSGHTAQAFMAATFLHKEFGKQSIFYSIGGYTIASAVGAMRVLNNRHYFSDVLVGAAMGILATNLAYLPRFHSDFLANKGIQLCLSPTGNRQNIGLSLQAKL